VYQVNLGVLAVVLRRVRRHRSSAATVRHQGINSVWYDIFTRSLIHIRRKFIFFYLRKTLLVVSDIRTVCKHATCMHLACVLSSGDEVQLCLLHGEA